MIDFGDVSYSTVPTGDDRSSSSIYISSGFRFGTITYYYAYVRIMNSLTYLYLSEFG